MKLWKYHTATGTVRRVEGKPYPGKDEDGETCYDNSHFKTEEEAWAAMVRDAEAGVSLAGSAVQSARKKMEEAEKDAASACADYAVVRANRKAALASNASADLAPTSGAQVQRLVGQTEPERNQ
jgi:hypothetical protein